MSGRMPKNHKQKSLFVMYFVAKEFGWTPEDLDKISAEDLDSLMLISQYQNEKRESELKEQQRRSSKAYGR